MLTALLAACALLAGFAGSWSPCGFSMVETLAPRDEDSGAPRASAAALAAFTLGALLGGAAMLGGLSLLGGALGLGSGGVLLAAAVVALLAAAADMSGLPVLPQVRRQVPEAWRRRLPLPLAGGLYGVLLGLGTTTFVLAFAVYALLVVAFAHADAGAGIVAGLAFGAGRALPVLVLARDAELAGERLDERPGLLRALRVAAALPLAAAALALPGDEARAAVAPFMQPATSPSTDSDGSIAWHIPGGTGALMRPDGASMPIENTTRAAVGGGQLAILGTDGTLSVLDRATGAVRTSFPAPDADAIAVSDSHVAWRESTDQRDAIRVLPLASGAARTIAVVRAPAALGRPAIDATRVVFHAAGRHGSRIRELDLAEDRFRTLRSANSQQLLNPSLLGDRLLYVRVSNRRQRLVIGARTSARRERTLYSLGAPGRQDRNREPGGSRHPGDSPEPPKDVDTRRSFGPTALADDAAYVTRNRRNRDGTVTATLLRVDR